MKPHTISPLWLTLAIALGFSLTLLYPSHGFAAHPIKARNKAEFTRFMNSLARGSSQGESAAYDAGALQRRFRIDDGAGRSRGTGYIPSPINTAHMKGKRPAFLAKGGAVDSADAVRVQGVPAGYSPPAAFDLRLLGTVSPVRDQGACGDCWAFATYGSMESNMLLSQFGNAILSPNHLNVRHGFAFAPCAGGNASMATAYLSRWGTTTGLGTGPVLESDDPYTSTLAVSNNGLAPRFHSQEVLTLPNRATATDNLAWKYAIQQFGGAYVAFYVDTSRYWNSKNYAYYYNGTPQANHAVTLVGWDDSYPASNFLTPPPGNGAYIIKNSWGTGWGNSGYFYISYYDTSLQEATAFTTPETTGNYTHQFRIDPYGQIGSIGYSGKITAWAGNIFTANAKEPNLQAVSFYSNTLDTTYTVNIYTNVGGTPTAGTLQGAAPTSGSLSFAGYHTVKLAAPVALAGGQKFSVVIKLTTPGYNYPVPIEYNYSGYTGAVTTVAGRSFLSPDGTAWSDLGTSKYNANIRAYTGLTLSAVPAAIQGQAYSQAITISDGAAPYAYAVVKGNLPAGLTLTPGGIISGTPTATGVFAFTVSAADSTAAAQGGPFIGARDYVLSVTGGSTQQSQTISLQVTPNPLRIDDTGTLSATASSGLPVTFGTSTPSICAITGNSVKGIAAGTCAITANQAGNANYLPAPQASVTLPVQKLSQTINKPITVTPATLSVKTAKTGTLAAKATSGLVVTFSTNTTSICSVSGKTVTAKKKGTCTILANQAGDAKYTKAPTETQPISVTP